MVHTVPVFDTVSAAFKQVFANMALVFKIGLIPIIAVIALNVVGVLVAQSTGSQAISFVLNIAALIIMLFFVLAWHRVVLFGINSETSKINFVFTPRANKFLGYYIGMLVAFGVAMAVGVAIAYGVGGFIGGLIGFIIFAAVFYVFTRLSLIFPAIAADHPATLQTAWAQSSGIFLRMIAINLLIGVAAVIILFVIGFIIGLVLVLILGMSGAGLVIITIVSSIVTVPIEMVFVAVFAAALSYVYRYVTEHPNPLDA